VKKTIAMIVSVLFVFAFASVSFAAEEKKEVPKVEKKEPKRERIAKGTVGSVDTKSNAITIIEKKGETIVVCDDKTVVRMGSEKKTCVDVKVGDSVTVPYIMGEGKNVAKRIKIASAKPVKKKTEAEKTGK